ncbi:MAG: thioredoxin family protein, partial [bacterium]|nr:thioredoxin family protein [bacterium]
MNRFPIRLLTTGVLTALTCTLLTSPTPAQDDGQQAPSSPTWSTDFTAAKTAAAGGPKRASKPLLVKFTGSDWCHWCHKLDSEVFQQPEFASWARDRVVLVEIDFPRSGTQSKAQREQNRELAKHYGVRGYPTVLLLDHTGKRLGKLGYERGGAKHWTELVDAELRANRAPTWHTDLTTAQAEAKKTGRPLLVNFTGSDWCHWCVRLKREVFSTPEFSRWAQEQHQQQRRRRHRRQRHEQHYTTRPPATRHQHT